MKKNEKRTLNVVFDLVAIVLAVLVVISIFITAISASTGLSIIDNNTSFSLINLFDFESTPYTMAALFGIFSAIAAVVIAIFAILDLFGIKVKGANFINFILGIAMIVFAIITFSSIPIDWSESLSDLTGLIGSITGTEINSGAEYISNFYAAGMWLNFIPAILLGFVAMFNRKAKK